MVASWLREDCRFGRAGPGPAFLLLLTVGVVGEISLYCPHPGAGVAPVLGEGVQPPPLAERSSRPVLRVKPDASALLKPDCCEVEAASLEYLSRKGRLRAPVLEAEGVDDAAEAVDWEEVERTRSSWGRTGEGPREVCGEGSRCRSVRDRRS